MIRAVDIIRRVCKAALTPRPVQKLWEWIDKHVVIPLIVGSTNPGPLDTALIPPMRGLYDLYSLARVHVFTLAKSARVGGTLFCICCILHKIATWPGPIGWVDPTRKTAVRFSRGELQPHIMECRPTAEQAILSKTTWTTLEMMFRACMLRLVGAGSAADLGGWQAELLVLNEIDKMRMHLQAEAGPRELAKVRTKQFRHTRKILENSTPTLESGYIWQGFLEGSQHYCYLPCPHCGHKQRLTFFSEEKEVPFDDEGKPLPNGPNGTGTARRIEKTGRVKFDHCKKKGPDGKPIDGTGTAGQYDLGRVETEAVYECAKCEKSIEHTELNWMLHRFEWRSHNPNAPADHISAHFWAAYSPFEHWGQLAKKFLQARGSVSKMHDFYNSDLGLPFVRHATTIKEDDIDRVINASPDYLMGQVPLEPIILDMDVDVQGEGFWWVIRAWGIAWDLPGWPTWSAMVDCGGCYTWDQIEEIAALKMKDNGTYNRYRVKGADPAGAGEANGAEYYSVTSGLVDSGYDAQQGKKVYSFCLRHSDIFNPSKGGQTAQMRGKFVTESPVADDQLVLLWYWDDHFKQALYYECIKERKVLWWLPRNTPPEYRAQLTAEHTEEEKLPNGSTKLKWVVQGEQGNHLGDCEKMAETRRDSIEERFEELREERRKLEEQDAGE